MLHDYSEYIKRLEKRFGKDDASLWYFSLCHFLIQLQKSRDTFISELEHFYRLIPGLSIQGTEQRPFSDEEIDRLLNSEEVLLIKDVLIEEGLLNIETLEEYSKKIEAKKLLDSSYDEDVTKNVQIICNFGNKKVIPGEESGIVFLKNYFDENGVFSKATKNKYILSACEISDSEIENLRKNFNSDDFYSNPKLFEVKLNSRNGER
jgi:hypothetical protein